MQRTLIFSLLAGWLFWSAGASGNAQEATPTVNLPPDLQEIVKLGQAQMGDDVIVSYVKKSGKSYVLSADQIIYLRNQGLSQAVISSLLETKPAAPPPAAPAPMAPAPAMPAPAPTPPPAQAFAPAVAPAPAPAPGPGPTAVPAMAAPPGTPPPGEPAVTIDYFHAQLAPYGTWVEVPGYGMCWSPTKVISATPGGDWRPYYDNGHWVYTENGWFWVSDYSWGDIPFHYGRWIREPGYGWLWVPDLVWGPAWVCWRHAEADGYLGWAPLPFGAVWVDGGWRFHGRAVVEVGFDFGLGEDFFVFVGHDHFNDHYFRFRSHEYAFHVHREEIHRFYGRSVLRNEFHRDEHGRFVNEGLGRARIEHATGHKVEMAKFEERRPAVREQAHNEGAGNRTATGAGQAGAGARAGGGSQTSTAASSTAGAGSHTAAGTQTAAASSDAGKVYRPPAATTTPAKTTTTPAKTTTSQPAKPQKK